MFLHTYFAAADLGALSCDHKPEALNTKGFLSVRKVALKRKA